MYNYKQDMSNPSLINTMKKSFIPALFAICVFSFAFAQEAAPTTTTTTTTTTTATSDQTVTIKGVIIDNHCAGTQKPEQLESFIKTLTKSCVLMPECVATGFSIFADGKLTKFDKDSNAKVEEFLNKPDNHLDVVVTAKKSGDELSLVSIENQQ